MQKIIGISRVTIVLISIVLMTWFVASWIDVAATNLPTATRDIAVWNVFQLAINAAI